MTWQPLRRAWSTARATSESSSWTTELTARNGTSVAWGATPTTPVPSGPRPTITLDVPVPWAGKRTSGIGLSRIGSSASSSSSIRSRSRTRSRATRFVPNTLCVL